MNIAFVNSTRKWGGVKTWCLDNAQSLIRHGHPSWIVGRAGTFVDKAKELGIPAEAHEFGFDMNPVSIWYFLCFFRKNKIDVLVANISKDLRTAGVAAKILGIPIVQHLGAPKDIKNRLKTRLTQRFFAPHLVTCSEFVRTALLNFIPMLGKYDFEVIHPGTQLAEKISEKVNSPRVIIATSQLNEDKRHEDMLAALSKLQERDYDFRCIIVGTGKDEAKLRAEADRLNLSGKIEWTGFVPNVQKELHRADIFVLPTQREPLGIALEEAMACGLVPIARNAGGVPEIWPPAMRDLMVDPVNAIEGFEQALANLIEKDDTALLAMKRKVYSHAGEAFEKDKQALKLAAWIQRFIA